MAVPNKDTIYIDIDDEITGIIDKVRASGGKIVALVLPKRASVLQSIVNMKLLKRAADEGKKNLVLVTTEASLMPLAGAVGLHVAKTPQSKPEIPAAPISDYDGEETVDEDETLDLESASTAAVAGASAAVLAGKPVDDVGKTAEQDAPIELDNEALSSKPAIAAPAAAGLAAAAAKKPKKNKKLAVPNFERFRLLLILGVVGLLLLVGGGIFAFSVLPKATIAINTDATSLNVRSDMTLDSRARTVDADEGIVPARVVQQSKTSNQQAPATGQQNNGENAEGEVAFQTANCRDDIPEDIPAGTGISAEGGTFITQDDAVFEPRRQGTGCVYRTDATAVVAQRAGTQYNVEQGTSFSTGQSGISAAASDDFTGGTDVIVKIVTQADIDAARQKLAATDNSVKQQLENQLEDQGLFALADTFNAGTPNVTTSVEAGATADNVTVTQIVTYTMFGAEEEDLNKVIDSIADDQIDTRRQSISDRGLSDAEYVVGENNGTVAQINLQTVVTAGPDLDVNELKRQIVGKKSGEVREILQANPGVTDVQVRMSPFYVTSVPKKLDKVTITIAEPTAATQDTDDGN